MSPNSTPLYRICLYENLGDGDTLPLTIVPSFASSG